jgi:hypothetical protein
MVIRSNIFYTFCCYVILCVVAHLKCWSHEFLFNLFCHFFPSNHNLKFVGFTKLTNNQVLKMTYIFAIGIELNILLQ